MLIKVEGKVVFVDCDNTLVVWKSDMPDFHGDFKTQKFQRGSFEVALHEKNIELVKQLYSIGWRVIAWSAGGADHAMECVKVSGLSKYVDFVMDKPAAYIDDKPCEEWMGKRIWK